MLVCPEALKLLHSLHQFGELDVPLGELGIDLGVLGFEFLEANHGRRTVARGVQDDR